MRLNLYAAIALASVLAIPRIAAADTIDDFTLVGGGYTITFSEPATGVTQDHYHAVFLNDPVIATVNGVPGAAGNIQILATFLSGIPSVVLSLPTLNLALDGPLIDTYVSVPINDPTIQFPDYPDDLVVTLTPGSYGLESENASLYGPPPVFSLTITPEAATTAATPEPGTLWLLSTGLAGGLAGLRRPSVG